MSVCEARGQQVCSVAVPLDFSFLAFARETLSRPCYPLSKEEQTRSPLLWCDSLFPGTVLWVLQLAAALIARHWQAIQSILDRVLFSNKKYMARSEKWETFLSISKI